MKRYIVLALITILLLLVGCESRLFHFTVTLLQSKLYNINQTGAFSKSGVITKADVQNALNVPENARITSVEIRGLEVNYTPLAGNAASKVVLTDLTVNGKKLLSSSQTIFITGVGASMPGVPNVTPVGLKFLIKYGIDEIISNMQNWIKKMPGGNPSMTFVLSGNTDPAGQKIVLDLTVSIDATIEYDQCIDVPKSMMGGAECDIK